MLCQVLSCKNIFAYGERAGPQVMADPGPTLTFILIAVFVVALAAGLLLLLGTKRQAIKSGEVNGARGEPMPPEPSIQPAMTAPLEVQPRPSPPAIAVTRTPTVFFPPLTPPFQPPTSVPTQPVATATPVEQYRQPDPPPATLPQTTARPNGLQAIIDIIGEGIEITFSRMADGIVFIFESFINVFKWIFRIDR